MVKRSIIIFGVGAAAVVAGGAIVFALTYKGKKETYDPTKEVYLVGGANSLYSFSKEQAADVAKRYGGTLATKNQLKSDHAAGAHWYAAGWALDGKKILPFLPLQHVISEDPAIGGPGVVSPANADKWTAAGVSVYGVKPAIPQTGDVILPFNNETTPPSYKRSEHK